MGVQVIREYEFRLREGCEAVGSKFAPDWDFLEKAYEAGLLVLFASAEGIALWQISFLVNDPSTRVAMQVCLWEPPGPRRGERYIRLLRESERMLTAVGVKEVLGVSKSPPLGGLDPVFKRVGWTPEEQSYKKVLIGGQ